MKNFINDFGFQPPINDIKDVKFGTANPKKLYWTIFMYFFLVGGIICGKLVVNPLDPTQGLKIKIITASIIIASFIIGLAFLAPLLRVISKYKKGQLSWEHCLAAFSVGFFSDLTFNALQSQFIQLFI